MSNKIGWHEDIHIGRICGFCKKIGNYHIYHFDFVGSRFCSEECALNYAEQKNSKPTEILDDKELKNIHTAFSHLKEITVIRDSTTDLSDYLDGVFQKISKLNEMAKEQKK